MTDILTINNTFEPDSLIRDTQFLYDHAPCGHICFRPDGVIISLNKTLLSWLGSSKKEVIEDKNISDILSKAGQFYYQMIVLPLINMQNAVNEINFDIVTSSDATFPCLFNAIGIKGEDKKIKFIHATIIKITERKKYESELLNEKKVANKEKKQFEFLADIIPNLIFTATCDGKINFMNARFYAYFNYTKRLLAKTSFLQLVYPDDRIKTARLWTECFKEAKGFDAEVRLKNRYENYEWFIIRAFPYMDETGNVMMWFGSCTNINNQKEQQLITVDELNHNLSDATEIIGRKEKVLKEIVFDQSHLIRMPLSNMLGIIEIINTRKMDEETKYLVSLLKQSSTQLDDVIRSVINKTYNN